MTIDFDHYEQVASRAVSEVLGQVATITPRAGGTYVSPEVDPLRPAFTIRGVFTLAPQTSRLSGQRAGGELKGVARVASSKAEFWISGDHIAGKEIRLGDILRLGDLLQDGRENIGPGYCVSDIEYPDTHDVNLLLTAENA